MKREQPRYAEVIGIGDSARSAGLRDADATSDSSDCVGRDGVLRILVTADRKVEFIARAGGTLARVNSALGYPAYYPLLPARIERPVLAVLMDLDGTSVRSEEFWVRIIERTTASLRGDPSFRLSPEDAPFVSGHSVSEHLQYCIHRYAPDSSLDEARACYFRHTRGEMDAILSGAGNQYGFSPVPGLREFLLELKARGIRIGLVTSGLKEKAWPEIVSAFRSMELGDPRTFYDAIITAGEAVGSGRVGTMGELAPKPHPWLYAETAAIGLGIPFSERHRIVGLEDSGPGVVSVRLAGFAAIGVAGGNIRECGVEGLCERTCTNLEEVLPLIV